MDGPTQTKYFILAMIWVGIHWNVYIYNRFGIEATISRVLHTMAQSNPEIALLAGGVICHIFWGNPN